MQWFKIIEKNSKYPEISLISYKIQDWKNQKKFKNHGIEMMKRVKKSKKE